ncbi:MAG TPA: hypothetical protein VIT65_27580 [Microlunatus sp.]
MAPPRAWALRTYPGIRAEKLDTVFGGDTEQGLHGRVTVGGQRSAARVKFSTAPPACTTKATA